MPRPFLGLSAALLAAAMALPAAAQDQPDYQRTGVADNMPAFQQALKAKLTFPMAWSPQVKDLPAWRSAGRARLWELTLQAPDSTPFQPQVIAETDRGSYVARQVVFNLSAESRVRALMLVPKGAGPFPAALMLHDHGGKFDIGKEKAIQPWGDTPQDAARLASSQAWADKHFSGRYPGDALARRGYVVLAVDALGWGDRSRRWRPTPSTWAARWPASWRRKTRARRPSWLRSRRWTNAGWRRSVFPWGRSAPGRWRRCRTR
jgi:hypothetical protein